MKGKFNKGDVIVIWENGKQTNQTTNMDRDRELSVNEVFDWQNNTKMEPTKMKVLSIRYPIDVEVVG